MADRSETANTVNNVRLSYRKWVGVRKWSGRHGFNPRSRHTKDFKNGT